MSKITSPLMHEQVLIPGGSPIRVKWNTFKHFTFPWHFHDEMEIVYVMKSYGKRFIADSVEYFKEGDLVMVGSQVPHYWKNADEFYNDDPVFRVSAVVVQWSADFLEKAVNEYPEMASIKELFARAKFGVHFHSPFAVKIGEDLQKLHDLEGFERFLEFVRILELMSRSKEYRLLASPNYSKTTLNYSDQRLDRIINFINLNYTEKITLTDLAERFGMNHSAMSRYFKTKTGKTPIQFINEMRINYACKLLQTKSMTVSQICFDCGFNNLSNFNRFFKDVMGITPKQYIASFV